MVFDYGTRFLVDRARDTLDTATASKAPEIGLGYAVDALLEYLADASVRELGKSNSPRVTEEACSADRSGKMTGVVRSPHRYRLCGAVLPRP